jgi:Zn-dependent M16 (insulinase) family peptidase
VQLKVESSQFEEAVAWIRDIIAGSIFSKDRLVLSGAIYPAQYQFCSPPDFRLSVLLAKQLQELPYEKRQGSSVARAWANRLVFDASRSTSENCSLLYLLENVPEMAQKLESNPDEVISALEELRKYRELCVETDTDSSA